VEHLVIGALALIDLWAALPPAIIMKTEPVMTGITVGFASSVGVLLTVYLCTAFRTWLTGKLNRESYIGARTERFMARYGTPGLGLLSPLILGPVLTCAGAVALGAQSRQLAAWAVVGVWVWAAVFYVLLTFGFGAEALNAAAR
jgi:hypothetical protein